MCYFNNKNKSILNERDYLQSQLLKGNLNLDFYSRLKQLNLLSLAQNETMHFIDAETIIRKNLASFLLLMNGEAFLKTKISKSEFLYNLNEFLFELTLCENLCTFLKNSNSKIIGFKANFFINGFTIIFKYKGKNETPRNYCNKVTKSSKKGWFYNTVKITFNCATTQKQKPSKLNLDGSIKNRLSAIYITLCLSGLKRFN